MDDQFYWQIVAQLAALPELLQPVNSGLGVMTAIYPAVPARPASPDIVYDYTKRGQVSTMKYPVPGITTTYGYNHRGWLQTIVAGGLSPLFTETLGYDSTGDILSQDWFHAPSTYGHQNYAYDATQRLVGWGTGTGADSTFYRYDRVGNRDTAGYIGLPPYFQTYQYNRSSGPNRLLGTITNGSAHVDYTFDADGAVTGRRDSDGVSHAVTHREGFSESYRGLLRQYTSSDQLNGTMMDWRYRYNAMGEREQKRLYDHLYTSRIGGLFSDTSCQPEPVWVNDSLLKRTKRPEPGCHV